MVAVCEKRVRTLEDLCAVRLHVDERGKAVKKVGVCHQCRSAVTASKIRVKPCEVFIILR